MPSKTANKNHWSCPYAVVNTAKAANAAVVSACCLVCHWVSSRLLATSNTAAVTVKAMRHTWLNVGSVF